MKKVMLFIFVLFAFVSQSFSSTNIKLVEKWVQPPDMSNNGFSTGVVHPSVLADDWMCTNGQRIVRLKWWGSYVGFEQSNSVPTLIPDHPYSFVFGQYLDITADQNPAGDWSKPGMFINGDAAFYDEYNAQYFGSVFDGAEYTHVYQYTYDMFNPWDQVQGEIYWISVTAFYDTTPDNTWAWHITDQPWNDDAVSGIINEDQWQPMNNNYAFSITTVPEPGAILLFGFSFLVSIVRKFKNRR